MLRRLANLLFHRPRNWLWRRWLDAARLRVAVDGGTPTIRLGTAYGGWTFADLPGLRGATVVSAGLGEDASFDAAFAARYGARVVVVDPTPRAVAHFRAIAARFGRPAEAPFVEGGCQPPAAYDLARVGPENLVLVEKALWIDRSRLKFYSPPDPSHVSHSLVNYQGGYAADAPHIEVEAISLPELLAELGVADLPLLKLDIEGAESRVVPDLLARGLRPRQILIEFDELIQPTWRGRRNFARTDRLLRRAGYRVAAFDGASNFLYLGPISIQRGPR